MNLTDSLVAFLRSIQRSDVPGFAVDRSVRAIADCLGVTFAGAQSPVAQRLIAALESAGGSGEALLVGTSRKLGLLDAALFNGTSAHALEFDDTTHPGPMHSSCHLVPVILSLAPFSEASGMECVKAYVAGLEVEARFAKAMNPSHYAAGWHSTSAIGTLGAAASAAILLQLNEREIEMCLGIAASEAAGLRANFGSMTKPLHAGQAARAGILAGLLAREGFDSSDAIFDRKWSYLSTFGVDTNLGVFDNWGSPLEITLPDTLGLKPYPCCGEATSAVELALSLRDEATPNGVARIQVFTSNRAKNILVHPRPVTVEQARFSLEFCVASALAYGRSSLETFTEAAVQDVVVTDLINRIEHVVDDTLAGPTEFGCRLVVELRSGRREERSVMQALGWADRWLTDDQIYEKFESCVDIPQQTSAVKSLFGRLLDLPDSPTMNEAILEIGALSAAS